MNNARVIDAVDFYWGASGGQARKALGLNNAPYILIPYSTQNNQPLPHAHDPGPYSVFWDCGGSPAAFLQGRMSDTGDYVTTDREYVDHVLDATHDPYIEDTLFALRDYPCEQSILKAHGRTVEQHQRMTTARHRSVLNEYDDRPEDATPLTVVQGWREADYLRHLDELRDAGVLTDYVSIGSVCAREDTAEVARIILAVADALPSSVDIHAFGIKGDVLVYEEVVDVLTSADSNAFDYSMSRNPSERADGESYRWTDAVNCWSSWRTNLAHKIGTETLDETTTSEQLGVADFA